MKNLNRLDAWSGNGGFSAPSSAQGYFRGGAPMMVASGSCGSSCGAGGEKKEQPKPSACGANEEEKKQPKPSACGTGGEKTQKTPEPSACGSSCGTGDTK